MRGRYISRPEMSKQMVVTATRHPPSGRSSSRRARSKLRSRFVRLRCVMGTPFGRPVLPLVKRQYAVSAGLHATGLSMGNTSLEEEEESSSSRRTTLTSSEAGSLSTYFRLVSTAGQRASSSMHWMRSGGYTGSSGTYAHPVVITASSAHATSTSRGRKMPTNVAEAPAGLGTSLLIFKAAARRAATVPTRLRRASYVSVSLSVQLAATLLGYLVAARLTSVDVPTSSIGAAVLFHVNSSVFSSSFVMYLSWQAGCCASLSPIAALDATDPSSTSRCARTRAAAPGSWQVAFQHSVMVGACNDDSSAAPVDSANNHARLGRLSASHVCANSGWLTPFSSTKMSASLDSAGTGLDGADRAKMVVIAMSCSDCVGFVLTWHGETSALPAHSLACVMVDFDVYRKTSAWIAVVNTSPSLYLALDRRRAVIACHVGACICSSEDDHCACTEEEVTTANGRSSAIVERTCGMNSGADEDQQQPVLLPVVFA
mmetsp:Transcript_1629/g.3907  ORF Transcript_1629/g.3907 Transcript_1629/m.3907 type:complete len:486 (+) Transcript_1629:848-2305(+)